MAVPTAIVSELGLSVVVGAVLVGLVGLCVAYCGLPSWLRPAKKQSVGSGANAYWNRYIDMNPPKHKPMHHKMKYHFKYIGAAGTPGTPEKPGRDELTGLPLTGHLVGRQIWAPVGNPSAEETNFSFDPSKNPVRIIYPKHKFFNSASLL